MKNYTSIDEYPSFLTVQDLRDILRVGRDNVYNLVNSGQFKTIKVGRQIRVPKDAFVNWLNN